MWRVEEGRVRTGRDPVVPGTQSSSGSWPGSVSSLEPPGSA